MPISIPTALLISGGVAAAGGVASSLIGSSAAKSAAETQKQAADEGVQLQRDEFNTTQANQAPWIDAGKVSLARLMSGLQPGGDLATPYGSTFKPPTLDEAKQTPGYQFALDSGEQALEHGAAAAGGAFTTGDLAKLTGFGNSLGQTAYQQAYNNAQQNFQTQFNTYNTNQSNLYNKLASSSGLGQVASGQLGQLGQQAASNESNLLTSAGAATAAGTVGASNAITGGIAGITNNLIGQISLQQLMNGNRSGISPVVNPGLLPGTGSGSGLPGSQSLDEG